MPYGYIYINCVKNDVKMNGRIIKLSKRRFRISNKVSDLSNGQYGILSVDSTPSLLDGKGISSSLLTIMLKKEVTKLCRVRQKLLLFQRFHHIHSNLANQMG